MNPLTNVRNIQKLNQTELQLGTVGKKSWHDQYKDSAWIFVGGLPYDLTEGDILCVFSQYGEIVNLNLVRDKDTGKSKGFAFICFEDQRSTVLTVDNLNSIKLLGRIIRVDHVENYKVPKEHGDEDELTKKLRDEGCAPRILSSPSEEEEEGYQVPVKKAKKHKDPDKKSKKKKKKEKKKMMKEESSDEEISRPVKIKKEKVDPGYDREERLPFKDSRRNMGDRDTERYRGDSRQNGVDDRYQSRSRDESRGRDSEMRSNIQRRDGERDSDRRQMPRERDSERGYVRPNDRRYDGDGRRRDDREKTRRDDWGRDRKEERYRDKTDDRIRERKYEQSRDRDRREERDRYSHR